MNHLARGLLALLGLFVAGTVLAQSVSNELMQWDPCRVEALAVAAARARYPALQERPLALQSVGYQWRASELRNDGTTNRRPAWSWINAELLVTDSVTNSPSGPASRVIATSYQKVSVNITSSGTVSSVQSGSGASTRGNPHFVPPPPPTFSPRRFSSVSEFARDVLGFDFGAHDFGEAPARFPGYERFDYQTFTDPLDPPQPANTNVVHYRQAGTASNAYRSVQLKFVTNALNEVLITTSGRQNDEIVHRFTELSGKALTDWNLSHDDGRHRVSYRGACGNVSHAIAFFTFTASTNQAGAGPRR